MSEDNEPARRFSDDMLIRLDQKVEDHLKWSMAAEASVNARLSSLEMFRSDVEKPVHVAGWIILTFIGAFVIAVAGYIWHLATTRIHFT